MRARPSAIFPLLFISLSAEAGDPAFVAFESGHVRPIAYSPTRRLLWAVNTPDNRLEIFRVADAGLDRLSEVVVGLEPVAVAERGTTVYVVNHLSDSVSVVDASDPARPFVQETLLVGDEPRDIVIAGPGGDRIFVDAARRGQNRPGDPQLSTPGVGRADVWVFEADDLAAPPAIVTLFTDTPRALAATPDGSRVFAAGFHTGNRTTVLNEMAVRPDAATNAILGDGFTGLGMPEPTAIVSGPDAGVEAPSTGVIVRKDPASGRWLDSAGRDWTARVRFDLPDRDVFAIDAAASPPAEAASFSGVGTVILGLAVHPITGDVWASNLESRNHVRFEPAVNGHVAENRVTILRPGSVTPVHLNPHIDYSTPSGPPEEIERSLSMPLGVAFRSDGSRAYLAAFGSAKVAVLDQDAKVLDRIDVGGGPSGIALDEARNRLYVMCRFDHAISVVDLGSRAVVATVPLRHDPEPPQVRAGRPLLYDARNSGHGDASCASCHLFGDMDGLAWDLGDPGGRVEENPIVRVAIQGTSPLQDFHPMKGPMTTQSLRGLRGAGAMHWRGDRNGVGSGAPDPDPFDEGQAFLHFRGAFQSLLGKATPLPEADMERFRDFILEVAYPPNPIARLDGTLAPLEGAGKEVFDSNGSRTGLGGDGDPCASCHALPLGTDGHGSFELETQDFKVAHLRNLYQKVGMFGSPVPRIRRSPVRSAGDLEPRPTAHLGEQVRGFGFLHDGSVPTLFDFFRIPFNAGGAILPPFDFPDGTGGRSGDQKVRELEAFLMAFPTGLAPAVGQQATVRAETAAATRARYETLRGRAAAGDCDLVAHGLVDGAPRAYLFVPPASYRSDRSAETLSEAALLGLAADGGAILTFTAAPPGSGERIALDRDLDGFLDGDERDAGSDEADPSSVPGGPRFLRGDCGGDGAMDVSDAVYSLLVLFAGAPAPPCREACDSNEDGAHDLSDAVHILEYLFLAGPPPGAAPGCESTTAGGCGESTCP